MYKTVSTGIDDHLWPSIIPVNTGIIDSTWPSLSG